MNTPTHSNTGSVLETTGTFTASVDGALNFNADLVSAVATGITRLTLRGRQTTNQSLIRGIELSVIADIENGDYTYENPKILQLGVSSINNEVLYNTIEGTVHIDFDKVSHRYQGKITLIAESLFTKIKINVEATFDLKGLTEISESDMIREPQGKTTSRLPLIKLAHIFSPRLALGNKAISEALAQLLKQHSNATGKMSATIEGKDELLANRILADRDTQDLTIMGIQNPPSGLVKYIGFNASANIQSGHYDYVQGDNQAFSSIFYVEQRSSEDGGSMRHYPAVSGTIDLTVDLNTNSYTSTFTLMLYVSEHEPNIKMTGSFDINL